MKKQIKLIFPAAFAVALFALPRVNAASANAATNAPASTATNDNSQAAMTALFGDPVIAKGNGFEIKRSELDGVMMGIKSTAAARGRPFRRRSWPSLKASCSTGSSRISFCCKKPRTRTEPMVSKRPVCK